MPRFNMVAVPATHSSLPLLKIRRRIVLGLLVASILSGFLALVISLASRPAAPVATGTDNRSAALAEVAARDFLAQRNSTVPAASGVSTEWAPAQVDQDNAPKPVDVSSLTLSGVTAQKLGDAADQVVDLVKFVAVIDGAPFELTVPMTVPAGADSPVLGGQPALVPAKLAKTDEAKPIDLNNYATAQDGGALPQGVQDSIKDWAAKFAAEGKDSRALRDVTNDQDQSRTYSGLGGWKAEVTSLGRSVPVTNEKTGNGIIVRVNLALTSPATNGPTLNTAYDVYVLYSGKEAAPPVVAWGPAGSAAELTPYTYNANKS